MLDIQGYRETGHISMGYGTFKRLRDDLLKATPLDFQLEYRLWYGSAWEPNGMMKSGPYIDYESFPDWDATPMRVRLWEFFGHPDCEGDWDDPKATAELLGILRERLPVNSVIDRRLLDDLIALFSESDEVRFL